MDCWVSPGVFEPTSAPLPRYTEEASALLPESSACVMDLQNYAAALRNQRANFGFSVVPLDADVKAVINMGVTFFVKLTGAIQAGGVEYHNMNRYQHTRMAHLLMQALNALLPLVEQLSRPEEESDPVRRARATVDAISARIDVSADAVRALRAKITGSAEDPVQLTPAPGPFGTRQTDITRRDIRAVADIWNQLIKTDPVIASKFVTGEPGAEEYFPGRWLAFNMQAVAHRGPGPKAAQAFAIAIKDNVRMETTLAELFLSALQELRIPLDIHTLFATLKQARDLPGNPEFYTTFR